MAQTITFNTTTGGGNTYQVTGGNIHGIEGSDTIDQIGTSGTLLRIYGHNGNVDIDTAVDTVILQNNGSVTATYNPGTAFLTVFNTLNPLFTDAGQTALKIAQAAVKSLTPTAIKTSAYTAGANEIIPIDATAGNVPITLLSNYPDKSRIILKLVAVSGTNTATYTISGGAVFNKGGGSTTGSLSLLNQAITFQFDATNNIFTGLNDDIPLGQLDTRFIPKVLSSATTITAASTLVNATFELKRQAEWFDFLDEDYITDKETWHDPNTQNLANYGSSSDGRVNGKGTFTAAGTSGLQFTYAVWDMSFEAPCMGMEVNVIQCFGSGTYDIINFGFQAGTTVITDYSATRSNIAAEYNNASHILKLYVRKNATDYDVTTLSWTMPSFPYKLGLGICGQSVVIWGQAVGETWQALIRTYLNATTYFDFTDETVLKSFRYSNLQIGGGGNVGASFKVGAVRWGYLKGVGVANFTPASFADGTPVKSGESDLLHGSVAHAGGDLTNYTGIITAHGVILKVNPTTGKVSTHIKIFTEQGGKIQGENAGCTVYDETSNKWLFIIPNWGRMIGGVITDVQMFLYKYDELPKNGVIILRNGAQLNVPLSTVGASYDPSLAYINGLWYLAYTTTEKKTNWTTYWPVLATSPDLVTWTIVGQDASATTSEGTKLVKIGGNWRVLASNFATMRVYDLTMTYLGSFNTPTGITYAASPHPCIAIKRSNDKQRTFWYLMDSHRFGSAGFSYGNLRIAEATTMQTGHDFPKKYLPDVW